MKLIPKLFLVLFFVLTVINCQIENKSNAKLDSKMSNTETSKINDVNPILNAAVLAGKNISEVDKILGEPTDSWTMRSGSKSKMQSYALGEDTTVEFDEDRIKSLVIFFNQQKVDNDTAYRLVGLDYAKPKPAGITNITLGSNWIKIFYYFV